MGSPKEKYSVVDRDRARDRDIIGELKSLIRFYRPAIDNKTYWGEKATELIARYKETGDEGLVQQAAESHILLAINVALKYRHKVHHLNLSDLTTEGIFGIYKAVKKFDPDHESHAHFTTFSFPYIHRAIQKAIREQEGMVRFSSGVAYDVIEIKKERDRYLTEHGEYPSSAELSKTLWISPSRVDKLISRDHARIPFLASRPVGEDSHKDEYDDESKEIKQKKYVAEYDPFGEIHNDLSRRDELEQILDRAMQIGLIDQKRFDILHLLFYEGLNNKEVGKLRGTTHQAVSELRRDALRKLGWISGFIDNRPERYLVREESRKTFEEVPA